MHTTTGRFRGAYTMQIVVIVAGGLLALYFSTVPSDSFVHTKTHMRIALFSNPLKGVHHDRIHGLEDPSEQVLWSL